MELKSLLNQKGLVLESPNAEEILARAKSKKEPVKIFYGETYDEEGNTIDSMKYYFYVSELAKSIKEEGFEVDPIIMIADIAACRNVKPNLNKKYMDLGEQRKLFVKKINERYNLGLNIIKMSDYLFTEDFQKKLKEIKAICKTHPNFMKMIEKSVPESKIDIEREKDYAYSFDEITTIIDLDIKVGPPRESLYDDLAREISKINKKPGLLSLFLTPTFPIGKNFDYFIANEGIEQHGITAYKAGSKRLQDFRILPEKIDINKAKELIKNSFISINQELPNPVLDIGIICEMARRNLESDFGEINLANDFYSGKISPDKLKEKVSESLYNNIIKILE